MKVKVKDFVGKEAVHKDLGRVFVDSAPKGSKKMVDITVLQRGRGWNEAKQTYEQYREDSTVNEDKTVTLKWFLVHTDEYGHKDQVSIDDLTLKE